MTPPRATISLDLPGGATLTVSWPSPGGDTPHAPSLAAVRDVLAHPRSQPIPYSAGWWLARIGQQMQDRQGVRWVVTFVEDRPGDIPHVHLVRADTDQRAIWVCDSPAARDLRPASEATP